MNLVLIVYSLLKLASLFKEKHHHDVEIVLTVFQQTNMKKMPNIFIHQFLNQDDPKKMKVITSSFQ